MLGYSTVTSVGGIEPPVGSVPTTGPSACFVVSGSIPSLSAVTPIAYTSNGSPTVNNGHEPVSVSSGGSTVASTEGVGKSLVDCVTVGRLSRSNEKVCTAWVPPARCYLRYRLASPLMTLTTC